LPIYYEDIFLNTALLDKYSHFILSPAAHVYVLFHKIFAVA
jgi:hypothetical protein